MIPFSPKFTEQITKLWTIQRDRWKGGRLEGWIWRFLSESWIIADYAVLM